MTNKDCYREEIIEITIDNITVIEDSWGRYSFKDDEFHSINGQPAVEYKDGLKQWFKNGKRHRLDGPAVENPNGKNEYYIKGVKYTEKEFAKEKKNNENKLNKSFSVCVKKDVFISENNNLNNENLLNREAGKKLVIKL